MTPAQKKNVAKFKKVQTIAKGLKKKNPKLSHLDAVKKAWQQVKEPAKKVGNVTIKKSNRFKGDDRYSIQNDGKKHLEGKVFSKATAKQIATDLRKVKVKRKVAAKKISGVHKIRPFTLTELKKLHPDFFRKGYEHYFGVKAKKIIVSDKLNCQVYLEKTKFTDQPASYTARPINPDGSFKITQRFYNLSDLVNYLGKSVKL